MRNSNTAIIVSDDPADSVGVALLDGKLKLPVELSQKKPVNHEEVAKAGLTLSLACELHESGDHRRAFGYAIRAARELFTAAGFDAELQEPLKHLFSALQDIDKGRLDDALKPPNAHNRRIEPSSEWEARACLAAAVHARMKLGENEREAAEFVRRNASIVHQKRQLERSKAIARLIDWRKQFRAKRRPPAGHVYFQTAIEQINLAAEHPNPEYRKQKLTGFATWLMDQAELLRSRLSTDTLEHE